MERHVAHRLSVSVRNRSSEITFHIRKHTALLCPEEFMSYFSVVVFFLGGGQAGVKVGCSEQGMGKCPWTLLLHLSVLKIQPDRLPSTLPKYQEKYIEITY